MTGGWPNLAAVVVPSLVGLAALAVAVRCAWGGVEEEEAERRLRVKETELREASKWGRGGGRVGEQLMLRRGGQEEQMVVDRRRKLSSQGKAWEAKSRDSEPPLHSVHTAAQLPLQLE